jgi:carotenoid cleavage dioxygenase
MPRINEAYTGRHHRYVYGVLQPTDREMRGVVKVDVGTGATRTHIPPIDDQNSEPVFVADPARHDAEDGGWLLFCAYRARTDTSDLVILDAEAVDAPPVATVHLPRRVPAGFHGAWLPDV